MKCSPLILEVPDSYAMAERRFKDSGISFFKAGHAQGGKARMAKTKSYSKGIDGCESHPWNVENLRVLKCATAIEQVLYDAVVRATQRRLDALQ